MPASAQGTQKLLDHWLWGMLKAAETLGSVEVFMRVAEEAALKRFFLMERRGFRPTTDPRATIIAYTQRLGAEGILDETDLTARTDGDKVHVEIGAKCPYRKTCTRRRDEEASVYCFRARALSEMLRITQAKHYDWRLESFGVPCQITLAPSHLEVIEHGK